jgi:GLPGLI family protein
MKKIILVCVFIAFAKFCYSQSNKQIIATYDFINKNENKIEIVNLYIENTKAYSEFLKLKSPKDTLYADEFEDIHFNKESSDSIGKQYFLTNKNIVFRDHIYTDNNFVPVIVNENMPNYDWKLESDKIKISNYLCNKAKLEFRGRNYNFWYTTEIPTQFGPWKFFGLPGLIVKIESEDNSIQFQLVKLEYSDKKNISKPHLGKQITFKEYVAFQEKITDDFIEKLKTKLPRGASIKVNKVDPTSIEKNYE